tara:strand:+ start:221 stop:940 length:720 start_codon:yes stop_codon:yes gene_type:complete
MTGIVIPDGGNIGSASDPDAISIASSGKPTFSQGIANTGTIDAGTLGSSVVVPASVGSSLVLIKSVDTTATSTTTVEFIHGTSGVVFDSTYTTYKVILTNCVPSSGNKKLRANIGTSSAYDTTNNGGLVVYYRRASDGNSGYSHAGFSDSYMLESGGVDNTISLGGVWGELTINEPSNSSVSTTVSMNLTFADNNGWHYGGSGWSTTLTNEANDRFKFYWEDASTFSKGRITLYGVKYA